MGLFGKKEGVGIQQFKKVEIDFNPQIPPLKKEKDKSKINVRYSLISPFAFAHIYWDEKISEVIYDVEEPELNSVERHQRETIKTAMRDLINYDVIVKTDKNSLMDYIDKTFKLLLIELGINMSYDTYRRIFYYLARDFIGFNEVDPLLRDYFVEDIECNGVATPIYIVHRIYRNIKTNLSFKEVEPLTSFVEKIAQ
ncbi:hypothetical protein J4229_03880, partial [Candidatus Pacearchaeota archaeon]|nr:hypothetical protein [Candidatus Pacearchaeota archaeon]